MYPSHLNPPKYAATTQRFQRGGGTGHPLSPLLVSLTIIVSFFASVFFVPQVGGQGSDLQAPAAFSIRSWGVTTPGEFVNAYTDYSFILSTDDTDQTSGDFHYHIYRENSTFQPELFLNTSAGSCTGRPWSSPPAPAGLTPIPSRNTWVNCFLNQNLPIPAGQRSNDVNNTYYIQAVSTDGTQTSSLFGPVTVYYTADCERPSDPLLDLSTPTGCNQIGTSPERIPGLSGITVRKSDNSTTGQFRLGWDNSPTGTDLLYCVGTTTPLEELGGLEFFVPGGRDFSQYEDLETHNVDGRGVWNDGLRCPPVNIGDYEAGGALQAPEYQSNVNGTQNQILFNVTSGFGGSYSFRVYTYDNRTGRITTDPSCRIVIDSNVLHHRSKCGAVADQVLPAQELLPEVTRGFPMVNMTRTAADMNITVEAVGWLLGFFMLAFLAGTGYAFAGPLGGTLGLGVAWVFGAMSGLFQMWLLLVAALIIITLVVFTIAAKKN